jgi:hypothetical protein
METDVVRDDFVPSAYKDMEDADKLTAPSFEKMRSGFVAKGTDEFDTQWGINRNVEYEVIISDVEHENGNDAESDLTCHGVHQASIYTPLPELFTHFSNGGAVRNSALSRRIRARSFYNARKVTLKPEEFVLVNKDDFTKFDGPFQKGTKAEANEALLQAVSADPNQSGKIMVAPEYKAT